MPKSKIFASFADAVRDIPDGSVIGFGGFAVVGMPINLYQALAEQGAKRLTCVSNGTRGGATMPEDAPTMEVADPQRSGRQGDLLVHRADPRLAAAGAQRICTIRG